MTRETKVGLAVAASFLSLVGVVVTARMTQKPEPSAASGGGKAVAQGPNVSPGSANPAPPGKREKKTPDDNKKTRTPAKSQDVPRAASKTPKQVDVVQASLNLPPPSPQPSGKTDSTQDSTPAPVSVELPPDINTTVDDSAAKRNKDVSTVASDIDGAAARAIAVKEKAEKGALDSKNKTTAVVAAAGKNTQASVQATAQELQDEIDKDKKRLQESVPALAGGAGVGVTAQGGPFVNPPTTVTDVKVSPPAVQNAAPSVLPPPLPNLPSSASNTNPGAVPPPPSSVGDPPPTKTASTAGKIPDPPSPATPTIPEGPSPAVVNNATPPVVPAPVPSPLTSGTRVAVAQSTASKDTAPAPAPTPPAPPNQVPANQVPASQLPPSQVPPIGGTTQVTSPPIPVKSQAPVARGFDVESTVAQASDQSFADISRRIYQNDQYAQALILFNRDHPFASATMKQDPPQLSAGMRVYFPPVDVLKSKYPEAFESAPVQAKRPSSPPVQFGTTTPLTSSPGRPNLAEAAPPGTKSAFGPGPGNTYRVRDGGERLYEIARGVLGDGNRWPQIYRLNPDVQPAYPIPAGTVLKLPAAGN
jgi:hypothetical protein